MTINMATALLDEYSDGNGRRDDIGLARLVEAVLTIQQAIG
jgi:hypothetical protein